MGAGARPAYRHLSRNSAHRKALLRNQVQSLLKEESIRTTWEKAKETQRVVEKLITLGKKNTNGSMNAAKRHFYQPQLYLPKLFGELRTRYADRPGGYTRVLRTEPRKEDQAASAILELVDGPRDTRFAMTARTVARDRQLGREHSHITMLNVRKVTALREGGMAALDQLASRLENLNVDEEPVPQKVYPDPQNDKKPKKARWTKN